jgi:hypothetical protein
MKPILLIDDRIVFSEDSFAEIVLWSLHSFVEGSSHRYKYRLAYIVRKVCVVRYDNERGKGDHRHYGSEELPYAFVGPKELVIDFMRDIERWNNENPGS